MRQNKGFTLVELLVVIAVIAILAAVVYVLVDPVSRVKDANDAERWSNVAEILNAVEKYAITHQGKMPNEASWTLDNYYILGNGMDCSNGCLAQPNAMTCLNLSDLITEQYFSTLPKDPKFGTNANTGYYLYRSRAAGIVTVGACAPENAVAISVSR